MMNVICCAMFCTYFTFSCMQLFMVTTASSVPTDTATNLDDENSGSGSDFENHTVVTSQMSDCQCNSTILMVDKNFLREWLKKDNQHSISKLYLAANKLKDDTEYLQVCLTL